MVGTNANNVTHERHEHELKKKERYFYHAAEVGVASLANTHFKWDKKNPVFRL